MHTAGPWEAPRNGLDGAIYAPDAPKGTLWRICDAVRGQSDEELSANARLIAAAPQMLAALKALNLQTRDWSSDDIRQMGLETTLTMMLDAIAKAEGQE